MLTEVGHPTFPFSVKLFKFRVTQNPGFCPKFISQLTQLQRCGLSDDRNRKGLQDVPRQNHGTTLKSKEYYKNLA